MASRVQGHMTSENSLDNSVWRTWLEVSKRAPTYVAGAASCSSTMSIRQVPLFVRQPTPCLQRARERCAA